MLVPSVQPVTMRQSVTLRGSRDGSNTGATAAPKDKENSLEWGNQDVMRTWRDRSTAHKTTARAFDTPCLCCWRLSRVRAMRCASKLSCTSDCSLLDDSHITASVAFS